VVVVAAVGPPHQQPEALRCTLGSEGVVCVACVCVCVWRVYVACAWRGVGVQGAACVPAISLKA